MQAVKFPVIAGGGPQTTISVIGLGYIGLTTSCMFASAGLRVLGVDVNPDVVGSINSGIPHFLEKALAKALQDSVAAGRLSASTVPQEADVFIIAVPTPIGRRKKPDLSYVEAATAAVATVLRPGNLVILESTSPVGTTRRMAAAMAAARPDLVFNIDQHHDDGVSLAFCPERVIPGNMLEELLHNDRVVGGLTPAAAEAAANVYRTFLKGQCHCTTAEMAEMTKLAENAFRDVNLAYANELWNVCHKLGLDAYETIDLANKHPRVNILSPGPGVGGHCIAVDPWFLVASAPAATPLLQAARAVNDSKPHQVVDHVEALCRRNSWKRVLCVGLTYKADVDDFRDSPALKIATELTRKWGRGVACVDPHASALRSRGRESPLLIVDLAAGLAWADVILCLVGHSCYVETLLCSPKPIIDVCGLGARMASKREPEDRSVTPLTGLEAAHSAPLATIGRQAAGR